MKALRYKDVKHDLSSDVILVPVYPEMKRIHQQGLQEQHPLLHLLRLRSRAGPLGPT